MLSEEKGSKSENTQPRSGWEIMIALIGIELSIISVFQSWLKGYEWLALVIFLVITATGVLVYRCTNRIRKWWINLTNQVRWPLIGFGVAGVCYAVLQFLEVPSVWIWGISGSIMGGGLLLSYFSLAQSFEVHDRKLEKHDRNLEKAINAISFARIAYGVFFFDRMKKVTLVYTHRDEKKKKCNTKDEYLRPSIPIDEEECVSLINHLARSNGVDIESKCSCELIWEEDFRDNILLKGNLIVIGSAENHVTKELFTKAEKKEKGLRYWFGTGKDQESASENDIIDKWTRDNDTGEFKIYKRNNKKDYGLITRMMNPLSDVDSDSERHYAVILGGCHRQGQKAITQWINNPDKLNQIKKWYPAGPFQILIFCIYEGEEVKRVDLVDRWPHTQTAH
jgi:hypothetical protein